MNISQEIREQLRAPMPAESITQHPTKTFLSTIKAIYIVERLNDVFGVCGWTIEHEIVSDEPDYVSMKGRIIVWEQDGTHALVTPWQYGGHKKTGKNTEPADGYKSAVTDCQSKCASYLEIGIDVFKGKSGKPGKPDATGNKAPDKPDGEMSKAQWGFIEKCGKDEKLSKDETIELVKWVAKTLNVEPRHWKVAKALLPLEAFQAQVEKYSEFRNESTEDNEIPY